MNCLIPFAALGMALAKQAQPLRRGSAIQALKEKGWSYRAAAPVLGVTYQYLCDVMNGHRSSVRLLRRVASLPRRQMEGAR